MRLSGRVLPHDHVALDDRSWVGRKRLGTSVPLDVDRGGTGGRSRGGCGRGGRSSAPNPGAPPNSRRGRDDDGCGQKRGSPRYFPSPKTTSATGGKQAGTTTTKGQDCT